MKLPGIYRLSFGIVFLILVLTWILAERLFQVDAGLFWFFASLWLLWVFVGNFVGPSSQRNFLVCAVLIAMLSIAIRMYWCLLAGVQQTSDARYYIDFGKEILAGKSFWDVSKQTGPSLLSALGMALGGPSDRAAAIPHMIANILQLPLVYLIARKLFGPMCGIFTLIAISIWPEHIFYSSFITAHMYQSFFLLLAFWLLLVSNSNLGTGCRRQVGYLMLSGFTFGIAQYMRGSSLLFFMGLLAYWLITEFKYKSVGIVLLGFLTAVAPIIVFNYSEFSIFSVSPARNSGLAMVMGTNKMTQGHYYEQFDQDMRDKFVQMQSQGLFPIGEPTPYSLDQAGIELAKERILQDPMWFLKTAVTYKWPLFWASGASIAWALEGTIVERTPGLLTQIEQKADGIHRVFFLFCVLAIALLMFHRSSNLSGLFIGFICGCFGVGIVHALGTVESAYHLDVSGFFPILVGVAFALAPKILTHTNVRGRIYWLLKSAG